MNNTVPPGVSLRSTPGYLSFHASGVGLLHHSAVTWRQEEHKRSAWDYGAAGTMPGHT
jgi:hypothetical protein